MYVLLIVVCPFVLFLLAIVLYVLLRYTDSDCPFGFFKLFLQYKRTSGVIWWVVFVWSLFSFCVVLLCVLTFWVSCYDVRYDFRIKTMFGSSLPPVVFLGGPMSYIRYLCLFACGGVKHIFRCVFALCFFVLCTLCCQFIWIFHFWTPLQYSLTFIIKKWGDTT